MALFALSFFFLLLANAAEQSAALPPAHPLHNTLDRINSGVDYVALVMAGQSEAEALQASGYFVPSADYPYLDLYGRRFYIGTIRDADVVYVVSGERRLNAGVTVQMLLDNFSLRGIVHFGIAGSTTASLSFGDVSVPRSVIYTGAWNWNRFGAKKEDKLPQLDFGEYNVPTNGENRLAGVAYEPEEVYWEGRPVEVAYYTPVTPKWWRLAKKFLKGVELQRCVNETYCLPKAPEVVYPLKASSSDIFVENAAYREFLFGEFGVSTVDKESSGVVKTAIATDVPVIVFRGASDLAGGEGSVTTDFNSLASANALKVAVEFIGVVGGENGVNEWNPLKLN